MDHKLPSTALSDTIRLRGKGDVSVPAPTIGLPPVRFDFDAYKKYVEDEDLTEAQARELLEAVWLIICGFVDMGFGLHPVQQALDACDGKDGVMATDSGPVLSCRNSFNGETDWTAAAGDAPHAAGKKDS